jgi:uncharacterized protein (DUF1778 family)
MANYKPKNEVKNKSINCRMTEVQHEFIKKAAKSYGLSMTDFIVECAALVSEKRAGKLRSLKDDLKKGF